MTDQHEIPLGRFTHDLLVHDCDEDLIAATRSFVEQALDTGGRVLIHSSAERLALLRDAVGTNPRIDWGLDAELYEAPMSTLFAYERALAETADGSDLWVAGTVPFGADRTEHPAWTRYESLVNEVLGGYAFHALCTYDSRTLPAETIAAARATHPDLGTGPARRSSSEYLEPADFLDDPRADAPTPPSSIPVMTARVLGPADLSTVRSLVAQVAAGVESLEVDKVGDFVSALHEVLVNGTVHGASPVELTIWADDGGLTCLVSDRGSGIVDRLAGYRHPGNDDPRGLWLARQLCHEVTLRNGPDRGGSVLLSIA